MVRFLPSELRHISISMLVLAVAISGLGPRWLGLERMATRLAVVSLPLAVGFIAHELAHKFVAMRYGYFAIYRIWVPGLLLALLVGLMTNGGWVFAAPGAVVILTPYFTSREGALIGLAGPLTNVVVGCGFLPLVLLGGIAGEMGMLGAAINFFLAFFNMLPLPPFDGSKVFFWDPRAWVVVEAFLFALLLFIQTF